MDLALLIIAHLVGDFLLQNEFIAKHKAKSTPVCLLHIGLYGLPFAIAASYGYLPLWAFCFILAQHFAQDRFQLHMLWFRWYNRSSIKDWPLGPLFVDQSIHLGFIGAIYMIHNAAQAA